MLISQKFYRNLSLIKGGVNNFSWKGEGEIGGSEIF